VPVQRAVGVVWQAHQSRSLASKSAFGGTKVQKRWTTSAKDNDVYA
jgi:hypothetical protein